jgi:hypothetical protein
MMSDAGRRWVMTENCYEMFLPFVLVKSHGGEFDDAAFVAGATCGALMEELTMCRALHTLPHARYIDTCLLPQVDLVAMHHGYRIELGGLDEPSHWQFVTFDWPVSDLNTEC